MPGPILSPIFRATTISRDVGESVTTTVTIGGVRPRTIQVTPSQTPDGGTPHTLAINVATPVVDMLSAAEHTYEQLLGQGINASSQYRIETVILVSGANGTTFDIVALL